MVKTFVSGALFGSMILVGAQAGADEKAAADAAAGPPKPAPELVEYMKDMVGTWSCNTTFAPGAFGPGSPEVKTPAKAKITKETALGGLYYRGEYSVAKSKTVPMAFNGLFYLGYDPGSKQITNLSLDNTGGTFMSVGPISGATASWSGEGYVMGMKVKVRETMTKTGPKQVTHKIEMDFGKGFQLMGEDVCKK